MKPLRTAIQILVLAAVVVTGFRHAMGWSRTSIETFCPFGGLEAMLSLVTHRQFPCATGERNLALFVALLALTLVSRKAFCGWVCPVGAVSEWFAALGRRLFPRRSREADGAPLHAFEPPRKLDRRLRWLRLPMLVLILYFTFRTGELIFRGFDPYYVLFSFHGHDVQPWSYFLLAVFLAGIVLLPMAWCRYLCPLGAALWPFSALGRLRLVRDTAACTGCRACDGRCPQAILVSRAPEVRSGECTLCLECVDACPHPRTLSLELKGGSR